MSVEVYIERLVVEGFEGLDGRALGRALERELTRRLEDEPPDPGRLRRDPFILRAVSEVPLYPAARAGDVGLAVARAIGDLLGSDAGEAAGSPGARRQE